MICRESQTFVTKHYLKFYFLNNAFLMDSEYLDFFKKIKIIMPFTTPIVDLTRPEINMSLSSVVAMTKKCHVQCHQQGCTCNRMN